MSKLAALKKASSLRELAPLLRMPASALSYTLYMMPLAAKYSAFSIPKKSGGVRVIDAPCDRLKELQRALAHLLSECRSEIEVTTPRKPISHGFRIGLSISTNARQHRKRKYVLNLDLENFFPTINFGRVRGFFINNKDFELNSAVATVIAQIACRENSLPQGSPSSPIISDLVTHLLDVPLARLAKKHKCTYSRYADDLTFSTNRNTFPPELAFQVDVGSSAWALGEKLLGEISRNGFLVNHKKTRMQYRVSQQTVTGLTVNQKVNVRASYYRSARLMCSALFATGAYHYHRATADAAGQLPKGTLAQLEGILSHIYHIKNLEKLRTDSIPSMPRQGIEKLYDRFLFFKHFVVSEMPLVICEGKTDCIYLDAAVRHLPVYAGSLYTHTPGKKVSKIKYFNYSRTAREVMGLGGGTGNFLQLIQRYSLMLDQFKFAPLKHPVILLVDNDDGAKGVFKALKHVTISHLTTAPFYRIARNLYLVKTPEKNANGHSKIEDLFKSSILQKKVAGKTFNPNNAIDSQSEYGKTVFAERVVAPNAANIDFSDFSALLDRILAVVAQHSSLVSANAV